MKSVQYVVWDPLGIIEEIICNTESGAINERARLEKSIGRKDELRIKKVFPQGPGHQWPLSLDPREVNLLAHPSKKQRLDALALRQAHITDQISVLEDRRNAIQHEIDRIHASEEGCVRHGN
jgi:hypothetical protein